MIVASISRDMAVPVEKVLEVTSDYEVIPLVHPWVEKITTIRREPGLVGSQYWVQLVDGHRIREEVIAWRDDGSRSIAAHHDGRFLKTLISRVLIEKLDVERTRMTIQLETASNTGIIGKLLARTVVKPRVQKFFAGVIEGVEKYALTGEPIDKRPM